MQSTSQRVFGDKVVKKRKRMKAEALNIILACKFSKSHAAGKTPHLIFQSETFLKDCKQLILGCQMVLILSLDQRKSERHLVAHGTNLFQTFLKRSSVTLSLSPYLVLKAFQAPSMSA